MIFMKNQEFNESEKNNQECEQVAQEINAVELFFGINLLSEKIRFALSRAGFRKLFPHFVYRTRFILWATALKVIVNYHGIIYGLKEIFRMGYYYFVPIQSIENSLFFENALPGYRQIPHLKI